MNSREGWEIKAVLLVILVLSATLISLTFVEESHASTQVVVNFDTYPNGTQVPSLEVITDQYAEWSVVFSPFRTYNLSEFEPGFAAATSNYSEPNAGALTLSSGFEPYNFINFTAWFKEDSTGDTLYTDLVTIQVGDNNIGTLGGNLTAYDKNGAEVGFDEYFTSDQSFHTLMIRRNISDIACVTFWTDSDGAAVDDFTFNAPTGGLRIEISPRGTYLHADPGQGSYANIPVDPPAMIDLQSCGFFEGDTIAIGFNGSVKRGPSYSPSPVTALLGLFSSTNELLPINETHRVPGAIEAGEDIITVQTWYSHEDTDIPEDFAITPATGFSIEIPQNATYLFICYHDSYYPDNTAPEPVTVTIARADVRAPDVGIPVINPTRDNVQPDQNVTVSVNVTDAESGVKNVTLSYSLDNGTTWEEPQSMNLSAMNLNATNGLYEGSIPGQPVGTQVTFKIVAFDNAENNVTMDGTSFYYTYIVVPEFPTAFALPTFMIMILLAAIVCIRKRIISRL